MELSAVLTAFVVMTFASAAVAPLEWNVTNNSTLPAGAEAGGGTVSLCASPAWALLPSTCHCPKRRGDTTVICRGAALEAPPIKPPQGLIKLDLSNNSITELLPRAFAEYEQLEELNLSENRLLTLNRDAFVGCKVLKKLHMQKCGLLQVPTEALQPLRMLNTLNLGHNSLTTLEEDAFSELDHLAILLLKRNRISSIHDLALANLSALRVLELDDNLLREFPRALSTVSQLKELSISGNRIQRMDSDSLPRQLVLLDMRSTALSEVADDTFRHMTRLRNM
ncbi:leucine-rich repeats and immunoglobulin-like domains protein 1 [Ctenocephalides felis]|uniref:leucine-rich repeats and immunoglobulin-like domains protein 1 n=2 Tax=Ctenocephalides felis TaxID=7515 RepID=UPI000E6E36FD|nr:leucine-rich repeats and immunoglobulin-like domains protein 1 [Ctenocephalides felis]